MTFEHTVIVALGMIIALGRVGLEEPRHAVPAGHALHREGCVEAPDMGREQ